MRKKKNPLHLISFGRGWAIVIICPKRSRMLMLFDEKKPVVVRWAKKEAKKMKRILYVHKKNCIVQNKYNYE